MNAVPRQPIVHPADRTRFLVAFGLVPLLLARDLQRGHLPWSFALMPTWSMEQLALIGLAGAVLGVTSGRPAPGLAGVALGILLGLAVDLWWLAGWVKYYDQSLVTMLPQAEWTAHLTRSALELLGVVAGSFLVGAIVRRLIRDRSGPPLRRPTRSEIVAFGLAAIGGPLLSLGIAAAAASSALVVPDGAQVQTVRVSAVAIAVDPVVLRPGPTRFLCIFTPETASTIAEYLVAVPAHLVAVPEGVDVEAAPSAQGDIISSCYSQGPGTVDWGPPADLRPGRYAWRLIDYWPIDHQTGLYLDDPRMIMDSPIFVVAP